MSEDLKDLLYGLLRADPEDRISIDEIIHHSWFEGEMPTDEQIEEEFTTRFLLATEPTTTDPKTAYEKDD